MTASIPHSTVSSSSRTPISSTCPCFTAGCLLLAGYVLQPFSTGVCFLCPYFYFLMRWTTMCCPLSSFIWPCFWARSSINLEEAQHRLYSCGWDDCFLTAVILLFLIRCSLLGWTSPSKWGMFLQHASCSFQLWQWWQCFCHCPLFPQWCVSPPPCLFEGEQWCLSFSIWCALLCVWYWCDDCCC